MKDLRNEVREFLNNSVSFNWKMFGIRDYVQICIEPGAEVDNYIISEWCKEHNCYCVISCVYSDAMNGHCLMIELSK